MNYIEIITKVTKVRSCCELDYWFKFKLYRNYRAFEITLRSGHLY